MLRGRSGCPIAWRRHATCVRQGSASPQASSLLGLTNSTPQRRSHVAASHMHPAVLPHATLHILAPTQHATASALTSSACKQSLGYNHYLQLSPPCLPLQMRPEAVRMRLLRASSTAVRAFRTIVLGTARDEQGAGPTYAGQTAPGCARLSCSPGETALAGPQHRQCASPPDRHEPLRPPLRP